MVDYNTLKAFKLVVDLNSFSAAARVLNVSQPAITSRVKNLEKFLGVPLFIRKGKSFKLSPYGEILYKEIDQVIGNFERVRSLMIKFSRTAREKLRFAASNTVGNWFIPKVIQDFMKDRRLTVELFVGNTDEVIQNIVSHYFDFGMVEGQIDEPCLNVIPIREDRLVLIKSSQSDVPDSLKVEELENYPIVIREQGSATRRLIEDVLAKFNLNLQKLKVIGEINSTNAIINFVAHNGNVLAFVPEVAIKNVSMVKTVEVPELHIVRKFSLVIHKEHNLNLVEREFLSYLLNISTQNYQKELEASL